MLTLGTDEVKGLYDSVVANGTNGTSLVLKVTNPGWVLAGSTLHSRMARVLLELAQN